MGKEVVELVGECSGGGCGKVEEDGCRQLLKVG